MGTLALTMVSQDAFLKYPFFRKEELDSALSRMTRGLGFRQSNRIDLPLIYTFETEGLLLTIMATPRPFFQERFCYGLSGILVRKTNGETTTEMVPAVPEDQETSVWRNHPGDFYEDLISAIQRLKPDHCLPKSKPKLLKAATNKQLPQRNQRKLNCYAW